MGIIQREDVNFLGENKDSACLLEDFCSNCYEQMDKEECGVRGHP